MSGEGLVLDGSPVMGPEQCMECAHLHCTGDLPGKCDAFPDGIPLAVWDGDHDHTRPYPGDHGITFQPLAPPPG